MLRSLATVGLVCVTCSPLTAQPPSPYGPPAEVRSEFAPVRSAVATGDSELKTIVDENPTLVRELLTLAVDDAESAFPAIFCLGTPAIEPLIGELKSENEELRTAAAGALCYACAHEDAPRSKIVKELIALKSAHPDGEYGELLVLVVRMTRPDVRRSIRSVLELQLTGDFSDAAANHCPPGGCPNPYVTEPPQFITPASGAYTPAPESVAPPVAN